MGYVRSTLKLTWPEDSEFDGLVVRMKRLSIRRLLEVQSLQDLRGSDDAKESMEALTGILDIVAGALIGWNLEEDVEQEDGSTVAVAIPATREALDDADVGLVLDLVSNWIGAASAVPLGSRTTSDGMPKDLPSESPEEWEAWSLPSQESLPEPVSS